MSNSAFAIGGGQAITRSASHANSFTVGQLVRLTGAATYGLALADGASDAEVVGMVSITGNPFTVTTSGYVSGLSGLVAGTAYFLDAVTPGAMTATEPSTVGLVSKPCFIADTSTSGYVVNMRGQVVGNSALSLGQLRALATTRAY